MKRCLYLATLLLIVRPGLGQTTPSERDRDKPTIRFTSTLVIVPTLVRSASGELVSNLGAGDFRLTDDGIEQKVFAESTENQPIAVVVVMQTGGAAPPQFQNYQTLNAVLNHMMGSSIHKVALVTFDSRPQEIWNFPPRVDGLRYAFSHPEDGDRGAAILDALNRAMDLLQEQPASLRRIVLLLSQTEDDGSKAPAEDMLRRLGESNTTIYSVAFSPKKTALKERIAGYRRKSSPHRRSPSRVSADKTLDASARLALALKAIREDTAAEVAALSGGEQVRINDQRDLERKLSVLANDFANCYTLSFQPNSKEPGFHTIKVQVKKSDGLNVAARASYWIDGETQRSAR